MLLNALSRLQAYLGPCRFILLCEPGKPLSPLLPHVEKIPPPRLTVRGWERVLRRCFSLVNRISLPAKLEKSGIGGLIWHLPWLWGETEGLDVADRSSHITRERSGTVPADH